MRITADRKTLTITIHKTELDDDMAAAWAGTNHSDWGGPDYPDISAPPDTAKEIIRALRHVTTTTL